MDSPAAAVRAAAATATRRLRLLSANIQAGASTRRYADYATRSWAHVLPLGDKRGSLDTIADLVAQHDIVGLQESDPGSWRSGFTNQTHYLAERAGFDYWSHQPNRNVGVTASNRRVGVVAASANALLSRMEPVEVEDHPLPGRLSGRGVQLKSPISTEFGWSCRRSPMKASCDRREPAPSDRCATATVRLWASRPKRAISTPRPERRPGNG